MSSAARRSVWVRTLRCALWYLPLVHFGYPALARWPARARMGLPVALCSAGSWLAAAGGILTAWSVYHLVRNGAGTPAPHDPPRRFVCGGPYRFCRNPMELGNLLTLIGRALASDNPRLALASLLFGLSAHGWIVLVEEPYLLRHFGAQYQSYRRQVPRWGWSWRAIGPRRRQRIGAQAWLHPDRVGAGITSSLRESTG